MLSETSREDMVNIVHDFLFDPSFEALKVLKTSNLSHESIMWKNILERYMDENINRVIFIGNEKLSLMGTKDFIQWAKDIYSEITKEDETFDEEELKEDYQTKLENFPENLFDMIGMPGNGGVPQSSGGKGRESEEGDLNSTGSEGEPGGKGDEDNESGKDGGDYIEGDDEGEGADGEGKSSDDEVEEGEGKGGGEDSEEESKISEEEDGASTNNMMKELGALLNDLNKMYPGNANRWRYFENKARELLDSMKISTEEESETKIKDLEALVEMIFEEWERLLQEKRDEFWEEKLFIGFDRFMNSANEKYSKINDLNKNLGPILDFLWDGWGIDEGFWHHVDWSQLDRYAKILEKEKALQELAELLGRAQESEDEFEEENISKTKYWDDWTVDPASKSEIIGVHNSDDLCNLLPSEVALLSDPVTETIFAKKFVEKKLLTFEYQGQIKVGKEEEIEETIESPISEKKGPIICCIDTSGSMSGTPERVAKAIVLALLKIALRDERKCYLISFSTGIETIDLSNLKNSITKLIEFLGMGFYGGTDATAAFQHSLKMLEDDDYKKADVLVVSDFQMPELSKELWDKIDEQKNEKEIKFHSLLIGASGNRAVRDLFDTFWQYETLDAGHLKKIVKDMQEIH